jgi:restriction system protein
MPSSNGGFGRGGFRRDFGGPRQMHKATCSECGSETEVPFRPTKGKPIFCRDCYRKYKWERPSKENDVRPLIPDFEFAGIADPDGQPAERTADIPPAISLIVCKTNDELIAWLRSDPKRMRDLPPRKFEELIAELLRRQGLDVDLTPCTRDGGLDIYAARKDNLGRFLYLVECKRYCPPHKVEVGVVRSLYGVVQEKRANAGVIVTTSFFTPDAIEFQGRIEYQMHLHDYMALQQWLARV